MRLEREESTVVPLKGNIDTADAPALFLVHTLQANARLDYQVFVEQWQYNMPLYGIQPPAAEDIYSMSELALLYVSGIMSINPNGPYLLAGWSLGGLICAEMARILSEDGHRVFVFALDSIYSNGLTKDKQARMLEQFVQHQYPGVSYDFNLENVSGEQQIERLFSHLKSEDEAEILAVRKNLLLAAQEHQFSQGNFTIDLLATQQSQEENAHDYLGWPGLAITSLHVRKFDDHFSLLTDEKTVQWLVGHIHTRIESLLSHEQVEHATYSFQLPDRFEDFTGRERIIAELTQDLKSGMVIANDIKKISGAGGVGKTQLAISVAHLLLSKQKYHAVIWINMSSDSTVNMDEFIVEQFQRLAKTLSIPVKELDLAKIIEQIYVKLSESYGHCLLVFDDATDLESVEKYLPDSQQHSVLVTSRNNKAWSDKFHCVTLDVFTREESICYIRKMLMRKNSHLFDEQSAQSLAKELGDFPLALTQALSYIVKRNCSIAHYLELLPSARSNALSYPVLREDSYKSTVFATVQIALNLLSIDAKKILQMIQYLTPDLPVDHQLLSAWLDDKEACQIALAQLNEYSLVTCSSKTNQWRIHRVIQDVVGIILPQDHSVECIKRLSDALEDHFQIEEDKFSDDTRKTYLLPHLQTAVECMKKYVEDDDKIRCSVIQIMYYIANILANSGDLKKAQAYLEQALDLVPEKEYKNRQYMCLIENLSSVHNGLGHVERSKKLAKKALKMREAFDGANSLSLKTTLNTLGLLYFNLGETTKAIDIFTRALHIVEDKKGRENNDYAKLLWNRANAYSQTKNLELALQDFHEVKAIFDKIYNYDCLDKGLFLNDMARVFLLKGDFWQAKEYVEKAYKIVMKLCGPNHLLTGKLTGSLAAAYGQTGDFLNQLEYSSQAIQILSNHFDASHVEIAKVRANLGVAQINMAQIDLAQENLLNAKTALERFYGKNDSEHLAICNMGLSLIHMNNGEFIRSIIISTETLSMRRRMYGEVHLSVAECYTNLAIVLHTNNEPYIAIENFEKAEAIHQQLKPNDSNNFNLAQAYVTMGDCYRKLKQFERGLETLHYARRVLEDKVGNTHLRYGFATLNLGLVYLDSGDTVSAITLYTQAAPIISALGENHPLLLEVRRNFAAILEKDDPQVTPHNMLAQPPLAAMNETNRDTAIIDGIINNQIVINLETQKMFIDCCMHNGHYKEALKAIELLKDKTDESWYYISRVKCFLAQGDLDRVDEDIRKAPLNVKTQQLAEKAQAIRRRLSELTNPAPGQTIASQIKYATSYMAQMHYLIALTILDSALGQTKEDKMIAVIYFQQARCYFAMQHYERAHDLVTKSHEIKPHKKVAELKVKVVHAMQLAQKIMSIISFLERETHEKNDAITPN